MVTVPDTIIRLGPNNALVGDPEREPLTVCYHDDERIVQLLQWRGDLNAITFPLDRLDEVRDALNRIEAAAGKAG